MKFITTIALMTLVLTATFSQTTTPVKKINQQELNQDLDALKSYIIQAHPDPFSVISKLDFEKKSC